MIWRMAATASTLLFSLLVGVLIMPILLHAWGQSVSPLFVINVYLPHWHKVVNLPFYGNNFCHIDTYGPAVSWANRAILWPLGRCGKLRRRAGTKGHSESLAHCFGRYGICVLSLLATQGRHASKPTVPPSKPWHPQQRRTARYGCAIPSCAIPNTALVEVAGIEPASDSAVEPLGSRAFVRQPWGRPACPPSVRRAPFPVSLLA
jgi:hypothetical protein